MFAKLDEILSMILQDIKETKRYGRTVGLSFGRTDGQRENSIPSHKHCLRGYNNSFFAFYMKDQKLIHPFDLFAATIWASRTIGSFQWLVI